MKPVPGSHRTALAGFKPVAPADPNQIIVVTLRLKRKNAVDESALRALAATRPEARRYLSRVELEHAHGSSSEDVAKVHEFSRTRGLAVIESNSEARTVKLRGTVSAFQDAFDVELKTFRHQNRETYRGRTGDIFVPDEIADIVHSVHGLDSREQAKPHFRSLPSDATGAALTPRQVATAYGFPANLQGTGQTIGLIELGGGFTTADLDNYFAPIGTTPQITAVSVDGAANAPIGDPNSVDTEVMLDIEVAGSIAPGAAIIVYFAPNTEQGFVDAVSSAVHDQTYNPSIISISWGAPEASWTQQAMDTISQDCQDAALLGITILSSSGDNGSSDGAPDGSPNVDFPSSSPYVIGCGGTTLVLASDGTIGNETAWAGSGGGESVHFPVPDYQSAKIPASFSGRGVPDVAGNADPQTGYTIIVDGTSGIVGGTSAVSPLYAGLIAGINGVLNARAGFLNSILYATSNLCNDVTEGTNGAFQAGPGWDATTGWGSLGGTPLLNALSTAKVPPQGGTPTTISGSFSLQLTADTTLAGTITATIASNSPAASARYAGDARSND